MNFRTILLIVVLGFIGVFAIINWPEIVAPTTLSLIVTDIQAPLGLVMLGLIVLLILLFLTFIVYLQAGMMADRRRMMRDLESQRELANQAEASRFSELRTYLEQAFASAETVTKESGNTLSAYLGELEDRLERKIDAK